MDDLYAALTGASPHLRFGLAFCEANGPGLVPRDANDADLVDLALRHALAIGAGHSFVIMLRAGLAVNVLDRVKAVAPSSCGAGLFYRPPSAARGC